MIVDLMHILAEETIEGSFFENIRPYLFVAGIVLAAYTLMRWSQRRMLQHRNQSNLSVKERVNQARSNQSHKGMEIYSQIGELMSQLADLSRQINGQIDTRIAKLELLIGEADQKIAILKKQKGDNSHGFNNSDNNQIQDGIETLRKISDKYHQIDLSQPPETPSSNLAGNVKSQTQNHSDKAQHQKPNKSDILLENKQIISLSRNGKSPIEIAQELNRPIGEIELILALNGKKYQ